MDMNAHGQVYLDHAAATPVDPKVLKSMLPYYTEKFYNPSALYLASKAVKSDVEEARARVAKVLGVRPNEVVFTAGGTEADNLAIHGIMQQFPEGNCVVSAVEHDAVLETAALYPHQIAPVTKKGEVDLIELQKLIDDNTVLVSVMHANNELGTLQPINAIGELVKEVREHRQKDGNDTPIFLHTDASQSANYLSIQPAKMHVDLMTLNGGKIYGPKQTGALYVRAGIELTPMMKGGGQERGLRSGTENVAGVIGFAAALERTQKLKNSEVKRLGELQGHFAQKLMDAFPQAIINSQNALVNFVHVTFPGVDNERLVMELDERGIQCAVGSACSASNDEPSHVLSAIGMTEVDAQSSIRFTMGRSTTKENIDYVLQSLTEVL